MTKDTTRAGANPAPANLPHPAAAEALPAKAVKEFIGTAAVMLEKNLLTMNQLLSACTPLASRPDIDARGDVMKNVVRLLRAQNETAATLVRVAKGESCHRIIVEFQGLPSAGRGGLNSKNPPPSPHPALAASGDGDGPQADR